VTDAATDTVSRKVAFALDGEWLCHHVRESILSDCPDAAERILGEIEGLSREQTLDILRGESTFNPALDAIVPVGAETRAAYQESLTYLFAGRIRLPGRKGWWRPCAAVTNIGPGDIGETRADYVLGDRYIMTNVLDSGWKSEHRARLAQRAAHYAREGEVAVVTNRAVFASECLPISCCVFFEACEALPRWIDPPKTVTEAVDQALATGHHFGRRGYTEQNPVQREYTEWEHAAEIRNRLEAAQEPGGIGLSAAIDVGMQRTKWLTQNKAGALGVWKVNALAKQAPAEEDAKWAQTEAARLAGFRSLRQQILDAAGAAARHLGPNDWRQFTAEDGNVYCVLRRPFDRWVLENRARFFEGDLGGKAQAILNGPNAPKWTPISPSGLKLLNDNPLHSDWILSANRMDQPEKHADGTTTGFWEPLFVTDPNAFYAKQSSEDPADKAWTSAFYALWNAVETYYLDGGDPHLLTSPSGYKNPLDLQVADWYAAIPQAPATVPIPAKRPLAVLLAPPGVGIIEGVVLHPERDQEVPRGSLCIVPHMGPDYYIPAASAGQGGMILAEAGGETAHLVTVGRDSADFPLLAVVRGALTAFPAGSHIRVNVPEGTVETL